MQVVKRVLTQHPGLLERTHKLRAHNFTATAYVTACVYNHVEVVECLVNHFKCNTSSASTAQAEWGHPEPTGWELAVHHGCVEVFDFLARSVEQAKSVGNQWVTPHPRHHPPPRYRYHPRPRPRSRAQRHPVILTYL